MPIRRTWSTLQRRWMCIAIGLLATLGILTALISGDARGDAPAELTLPVLTGFVVDEAGLIDEPFRAALTEKLTTFNAKSPNQLVVVTLRSLQAISIEHFSVALFNNWDVAQKDKNKGVLLVVAPNERKVRIQVGNGNALKDATAKSILEESVLPRFRANDLRGGIVSGVDAIIKLLEAEGAKPAAPISAKTFPSSPLGSARVAAPAAAGRLEDAAAAYAQGDYATALRLFRPLADQGDAQAQFNLGFMYHNGQGVAQSDAEALKWYRKAAEQGTVGAQFNLGVMYAEGRGVRQNNAEALKWFRKAADQGDAQSQHNLGVMYDKALGVPQNNAEALKWYRKAADQGDVEAQFNVGVMYDEGRGVPPNGAEALKWYRKAADQDDLEAKFNIGVLYYKGRGVAQDFVSAHMWFSLAAARGDTKAKKNRDRAAQHMTPAQIAEAQKLAREWKPSP